MGTKLITLAAIAFVAVVGITVSIGFLTVQQWWDPLAPWLYVGGGLVGTFAVVSAIWFRVTRDELEQDDGETTAEERGFERLVGLLLLMVFGIFALLISALWNFDTVRAWSLVHLADNDSKQAARALVDPSARVKGVACELLFERGIYPFESRLHATLDGEPETAAQCLTKAMQADTDGYRIVASRLLGGWGHLLMNADEQSVDQACRVAAQVSPVSKTTDATAGPSILLQCSMKAANASVRTCCADELAEEKFDRLDQIEIDSGDLAALFSQLVIHGFEASDDVATVSNARRLELQTRDRRREIVELGCDLFESGYERQVIRGFVPLLESDACGLNEETQLFFTAVEPWPVLCDGIRMTETTVDVGEQMCELLKNTVKDAAIARASDLLRAATRSMMLEAMATTLESNQGVVAAGMRRQDPMDFSNIEIIRFYQTKDTDHILGRNVPRECVRVRNDMMTAHRLGGLPPNEIEYERNPRGCTPHGLNDSRTLEQRASDDFGAIGDILSGGAMDSDAPDRGPERESTRLRRELRQKYSAGAIERATSKVRGDIRAAQQSK